MISTLPALMISATLASPWAVPIGGSRFSDLDRPRSAPFYFDGFQPLCGPSHVCLAHAVSGDIAQPDNIIVLPAHSASPSAKAPHAHGPITTGVFTDVRKVFTKFAKRSGG